MAESDPDRRIEVGAVDDVVATVGGDTYSSEYDANTEQYGRPTRTVKFADELVDILERRGRAED